MTMIDAEARPTALHPLLFPHGLVCTRIVGLLPAAFALSPRDSPTSKSRFVASGANTHLFPAWTACGDGRLAHAGKQDPVGTIGDMRHSEPIDRELVSNLLGANEVNY